MEELIKGLGINKKGTFQDSSTYIIDLSTDKEFSNVCNILEKNEDLEFEDESSTVTIDNANINYTGESIVVNAIADWNANTYKIVIKEVE